MLASITNGRILAGSDFGRDDRHNSSRKFRWKEVQVGFLPVGLVTLKKEFQLFYLLCADPRNIVCRTPGRKSAWGVLSLGRTDVGE